MEIIKVNIKDAKKMTLGCGNLAPRFKNKTCEIPQNLLSYFAKPLVQ